MEKVIFANMCMIEDGCGRVVVQKRTGTSWNGYAFPGGHVEDGESFADAVRREVRECSCTVRKQATENKR